MTSQELQASVSKAITDAVLKTGANISYTHLNDLQINPGGCDSLLVQINPVRNTPVYNPAQVSVVVGMVLNSEYRVAIKSYTYELTEETQEKVMVKVLKAILKRLETLKEVKADREAKNASFEKARVALVENKARIQVFAQANGLETIYESTTARIPGNYNSVVQATDNETYKVSFEGLSSATTAAILALVKAN